MDVSETELYYITLYAAAALVIIAIALFRWM